MLFDLVKAKISKSTKRPLVRGRFVLGNKKPAANNSVRFCYLFAPSYVTVDRKTNILMANQNRGCMKPISSIKQNKATAQSAVEFALVLPLLLLIMLGLIETGRLIFHYSTVTNAAARPCAMAQPRAWRVTLWMVQHSAYPDLSTVQAL
jgi:hypothetical protein